ncbi:MAG: hypothetical protein LR001_01320 [Clostridiales bacterium]|nr:hypothetical protein [Clostridiales bacterium]
MYKFCTKSATIGIGIGMILIASINLLFYNPTEPSEDVNLTSEELNFEHSVNRIKNLLNTETDQSKETIIENINSVDESNEKDDNIAGEENNKEVGVDNQESRKKTETENATYVLFEIDEGMNSTEIAELLYEKGLVKDVVEFIEVANRLSATRTLKHGKKVIPQYSTIEEIIKILIK